MPNILLCFTLFFALGVKICAKKSSVCVFPEARERALFFDIPTNVPARSILVDTVVEPSDAKLSIANIRANNLEPDVDLDAQLALEKRPNGQFLVITAGFPPVVRFPDYPSTVNETLLYVTVRCNGRLYPLITVRVRNANMHTPEFLGTQPYELSIARNAPAGTLFETPLKALDLDAAEQYSITFGIEPPFDRDFALVPADQPSRSAADEARLLSVLPPAYSRRVEHWHQRQMPPSIQLKVLAKSLASTGKSVYYLNVSANDNGQPEAQVAYAQLKVSVKEAREAAARFSRTEYFANFTKEMVPGGDLPPNGEQPIQATFPAQRAGDRVRYELDQANPYAQLFEMDPWTGRLRLAQRVPDGVPPALELDLTAHLIPRDSSDGAIPSGQSVRAKITLVDQTEVRLTYFAQCHYETHLAENPSAYTRVLHFNFRGDVQGVELLNGSDLFKVDSDGMMSVRPGVNIDRENTDRIVVKARLKSRGTLHPRSLELCQIATADIRIDDVNDHSPRFKRRSYRFRIDAHPFNNTEVGSLRAIDGDKGEFGRVRYRLLEEFVPDGRDGEEPLPFVMFQGDGAATLFFVIKPLHMELGRQPYQPQQDYTFTVEAFDSTEDPRTARVTVNVRLADLSDQEAQHEREEAVRERQWEQQQEQQFELQQDEPSTHMELEEDGTDTTVVDATMLASHRHGLGSDGDGTLGGGRAHAVPTFVLDGTGAKTPLQMDNKFGDLSPPDDAGRLRHSGAVAGLIRFSADKYIFRLRGPLTESQTIGQVKAKRMGAAGGSVDARFSQIEFAVEEGIAGFVGVDAGTGRLFVGPWLLRDRFEEIRFSVAAQQPADGQVLATALVSVLIDDMGPPEFSTAQYQFELDQSGMDGTGWPRIVGQVNAFPFAGGDANGTAANGSNGNSPSTMFFYAFDDEQPNNNEAIKSFDIDQFTGLINARGPIVVRDNQRKSVKFGLKACLRANATTCGRSSVEVIVFNNSNSAVVENGISAVARVEFIPLPRTVFLTTGKVPGSSILRVSVRALDPRDGNWRLLPPAAAHQSMADDQNQHQLQVIYTVEVEGESQPATTAALFRMRDNILMLAGRAEPGEFNLTIRAHLSLEESSSTPEEGTLHARDVLHSLRVIVMHEDGRQRYPVFERISYEFEVEPSARFPLVMQPSLNATLADHRPIRFSLFPARAGDPTDGLHIDAESGQLLIQRQFLDAIKAINQSSEAHEQDVQRTPSPSSSTARSRNTAAEVFIVVRATNRLHPEFYSDASVALLVRSDRREGADQSPLEFDASLYRVIVREDALVGTVLNGGAPITVVEPERHQNVRLRLQSPPDQEATASLINSFQLLDNGSLVLTRQLDIELMDDASKGVVELEAVADEPNGGSSSGDDKPSRARVQVQVVDVDEFAPHFVPSSPEFRLHMPLIAGQPIGHLKAHDDDFADRQPNSLVFRTISGNASELVHVQRDGQLLVKDPKSWQPSSSSGQLLLFLLVEVRGTSGQTSRTTVKFVLEDAEANAAMEQTTVSISSSTSETEQQPQEDEAAKDTATTVDTRGTTLEFTAIPVQHALFSVRDSLSPDELVQLRAGQLHFRLEESAQRTGSLFRLDANTGELFMEDNAAFSGMVSDDTEHEVSVQVLDQDQQLVARRLFTVRLVQRTSMSTPTSTTSNRTTAPTTTTTTTTTTIGTSLKTAEEEASSSLKPTTTAIRWRLSQLHGAGEGNEGAETSTTLDESDEPFSTKTDIIPPAFSLAPPSNSRRAPTAAPLLFNSTSAPGTTTTSSSTGTLKFALPRYHWIVSEPIRTALIGKLEVQGDDKMLESIIIEPPQFRTWFQLDQKSGELYLREVPDQLYGRQRAEFRAHLIALDGKWADAIVIVDLNLPPPQSSPTSSSSNGGNVDGTIVSNTDHRRTTIGQISTPGIEIAESSDQASRTAVASDTDTKTGSHKTASTPASIQLSSSTSTTLLPSASRLPARISSSTSSTSTTSFSTRSSTTFSTTSSSHTDASSSPLSDQSSEESTDHPPFDEPTDHSSDQSSSSSTPSTTSWHTTLSSTSAHSSKLPEQENKIPSDKLHFASDEYRAMLPEGRYGNSGAQLSLRPQSLAQGMPRGVEFSVVADQPAGGTQQQLPFFVRRDTGELIAFAETDREEQAQYQFSVRAFDPVRNRSAETRVSVNILDVNDNFPQFVEPLPRVIAVGRLSTPGTVLAQFHAVDLDEGAHGTVRFLMALDNNRNGEEQQQQHGGQQPFDMEPDGRLMFRGLPQQDGGVQDIFELRISAVDGGRPALRTEHKLRVELFAEGQPPTFKQSDFTAERVPAGAAQNGTFVAQVVAGTSDQIEYSLIDPPMANLFVIDSRTGQIRMGRRPLDAERVREWTLHVRAKEGHGDRATSARTTVHVFLDTFRPESPEGAEVESERLPSPSSSTTTLTTASNDGTVVVPSGECRFSDRVFHSEIAENTEGRQRLTTLGTSDACAGRTLRFTLQQSNDAFVLDERTGDLYAVQPLDRERKSLYFLVTNLLIVNSNQQQHRPPPSTAPSAAAAAVGMATVREVELEVHPAAQASTTDDGTTEEEDDTGEEANANRRKIRRQAVQQQQQQQPQQQQRTKTKATRELFNGLVEQAKSKLEPNQALVLVHVLDRDDNTPQFEHLSEDGQIVFAVDWQLPVLGQIGRAFAHDADEHATLHYKLEQNANMAPMFAINETTGVVTLMRSFQAGIASADGGADEFRMNVFVSDGQHIAKAPLLIYKLQPGTNIVLLVINQPADQVDVLRAVRHMNTLLHGMEADVLVKQVFIGEDGQADTRRTHLLVYAVDKRTRVPVPAAKLKELLDIAFGHSSSSTADEPNHHQQASASSTRTPLAGAAADSPLRFLASVYVPEYAAAMESSPFRLTTAEITLLAISVLLVFCVCAMLFVLLRCCKNKQQTITKSDVEYMLDAQQAGPRPYNVELITRKMAQSAAGRRLPKPLEQSTLSPESRATMVASSGIYGVGTTTTGQRRTGAGTRGAIAGTGAGADTTSSSERSGDSLPQQQQQQQQQNGDRSDLQNLLMVRRRNSRSGNRTADQRRIQPITYESYDDAGVDDGAGACSIDGGPMLDTMSSSVEHSPEMARSGAGAGLNSLLDASTAVGTVGGGTNRRGAPPREPPLPPPAANGPPATNIAGQRQQQAATIIGSTMA